MSVRPMLTIASIFGVVMLTDPAAAIQAPPKSTGYDAGERICEKLTVVGSRLAVKKVCMTRGQWDERRREDRDAIDQAQRSPCVLQHTSGTGRPGC